MTETVEVILVDDIRMWRESMTSHFKDYGVDVKETAENGEELIRLLRTGVKLPNIVLLDLEMPVLDGSQALDIIRIEYPNLKVIITTQYDDESLIKDFFNRGACAYVPKNSNIEILVEAIFYLRTEKLYTKNLEELFKSARANSSKYFFKMLYTEIINLLCEGISVNEIANRLCIGEKTVETHLTEIYKKAGVGSRYEFLTYAIKSGLNYLGTKPSCGI